MSQAAIDPPCPGPALDPVMPGWWGDVLKATLQYGFAATVAFFLLWYVGFFIVEPMRHDQQQFMQSVIAVNAENAKTMSKQTEIQQQQASAMSQLVPLLQQIRDDQRRGAWRD